MSARILVIEDNADSRRLMSYLLTGFGHTAIVASSGEEGVRLALAEPPDLVLMDLHMPGIDGYETARRMRAEQSLHGVPIIAVTALAMVGDRNAVLARGFDGYISKPIDPASFVEEMEGVLRTTGASVEARDV